MVLQREGYAFMTSKLASPRFAASWLCHDIPLNRIVFKKFQFEPLNNRAQLFSGWLANGVLINKQANFLNFFFHRNYISSQNRYKLRNLSSLRNAFWNSNK
jgi:hypothetical protein